MTKKRILSVLLTIAMILSVMTFVGCGSKKAEEPKPTNAKELLDANKKAQKEAENYSFTGKGSAEIKLSSAGQEMKVPASFDATGEISKDIYHLKGSASVEALGEKQNVDGEVFMDIKNKKVYSKTSDAESWSSSDMDVKEEDLKLEVPDNLVENLEFSEEDEAYVLTSDLSKIDIKELLKSMTEDKGDVASLDQALAALDSADISINSGTLKLAYDKDSYLIKSMTIKDFAGSGKYEYMEGQNMDITASLTLDITFSDYNKVSADKFELPKVD